MDKKPRKPKKPIDIKVDTKNVDIEIKRDEKGNVKVDVDTKRVDVHFEKNEDNTSLDIEIDDAKEYEFESFGNRVMPKGTIWKVTGAVLKIFLQKKLGRIKK